MVYRAGAFLNADLDKASDENERNALTIGTSRGRIGVVQIAGLVARRIVPFVREGQSIGCMVTLRGDRMYEFFDRLVNVALPRVRDFRGVSSKAFRRCDDPTQQCRNRRRDRRSQSPCP